MIDTLPPLAALQGGPTAFKTGILVVLGIAALIFFVVFLRYANLYVRSLLTPRRRRALRHVRDEPAAREPRRRSSTRA